MPFGPSSIPTHARYIPDGGFCGSGTTLVEALRAGRTVGLAGGIAYAGYGTGVHDALHDPEGTTSKILEHVLVSVGGRRAASAVAARRDA